MISRSAGQGADHAGTAVLRKLETLMVPVIPPEAKKTTCMRHELKLSMALERRRVVDQTGRSAGKETLE